MCIYRCVFTNVYLQVLFTNVYLQELQMCICRCVLTDVYLQVYLQMCIYRRVVVFKSISN